MVGELDVYDVPGFKDTNPNKEIVINILHKCLLTRLKKAKFLVVVNVRDLFDEKLTKLIDDYHNKLKELFGEENYEMFVKSIHFILTQNDRPDAGFSAAEIKAQISEKAMESIDLDNLHLPLFMKRLHKHHLMADYKYHTGNELLGDLTGIVNAQADGANLGVTIPEICRKQLDLHANKLNNICIRAMDEKIENFEGIQSTNRDVFASIVGKLDPARDAIFKVETMVSQQKFVIAATTEDTAWQRETMKANVKTVSDTEDAIKTTKIAIVNYSDQISFMNKELKQIPSVSLRADVAIASGFVSTECVAHHSLYPPPVHIHPPTHPPHTHD